MAAINLVKQRNACDCKRIDWCRATIALDETLESFAPRFQRSGMFPFMQLPMELRVMVYAYHFIQPPIKIYGTELCSAGHMCPNNIHNANIPVGKLILASKTVYNEALSIYLRNKAFLFLSLRNMSIFAKRVGPFQRDYITSLAFSIENYKQVIDALPISRLAVQCKSLRQLSIMVRTGSSRPRQFKRMTERQFFQNLSLSRNIASVETDVVAEVITFLFVPWTERISMQETPSARGRTLVAQTTTTPKPSLQAARTDFSSVTDIGTRALTVSHIEQHRQRPWRRGSIDYENRRQVWVPQPSGPGIISICDHWS